MADKVKAPVSVIILIVLLVVSLCLAGVIFNSLQRERTKSLALQEELNNTKEIQKMLESKLEEAKRVVQGLESKLKDNIVQIDSLNKELRQERAQKEEALSGLQQLKGDLEQQKTLRSDLEKKFTQTQTDVKKMQSQLNALESKKTELETKIKELEGKSGGVELGTIVVNPEVLGTSPKKAPASPAAKKQTEKSAASVSAELEGKILVVNKDYNFAVINLGSKDGIGIGNEFSVYHDNKYIGDVKVEKLHDSMAAADFISPNMKDKIIEGDRVVRKSK